VRVFSARAVVMTVKSRQRPAAKRNRFFMGIDLVKV
jgi:hypothetical protein